MLRRILPLVFCLMGVATPALSDCVGRNLMQDMPEAERAALVARSQAVPFAEGNLWRATKGSQDITVVGTYHMDDPRHAATLDRLAPVLDRARLVLVEAGPEEMTALKWRMAEEPDLMFIMAGPTLQDQLEPAIWAQLSVAMEARGVPAVLAAKMQPWYLSMLLSIPPCALESMGEDRGLDARVIEAATARGLPIRALEPFDTIFGIFDGLAAEDQLSMITGTLALESLAEDMSVTMADAYFNEQSRLIWDFSREQALGLPGYTPERVAHEFDVMEQALMVRRNRDWIPVLTAAAAEGPVLAAFGALHLPGEEGVLALLRAEGFTLERLAFR